MNIAETYKKVLEWYKGLVTWKKVVFFLVLVVIAILGILYAVYRVIAGRTIPVVPEEVDGAHSAVVNNVVATSKAEQKKLEAELIIKKSEAMQLAQERVRDAGKQRDVRDLISNAQSFDEVDSILKGLKK